MLVAAECPQIGLFWCIPNARRLGQSALGKRRRHSRPLPSTMPQWGRCSFRLSSLWERGKKTDKQKRQRRMYTPSVLQRGTKERGKRPPRLKKGVRGEGHGIKKKKQILCGKGVETRGRFLHVGNFVFLFVYCGLRKLKRKWENEIKVMRMTERRGFCGKGK